MERFLTLLGPMVWPLATLLIAMIFRRDVGQALGRVGRVKYRDLELTFRDDLRQAEELAKAIPPPPKGALALEVAPDEAGPLVGRMIAPLDRRNPPGELDEHPREAVGAAWGLVARALAHSPKFNRVSAAMDRDLDAIIGRLRALRDRAARPDQPAPSHDDARRFIALARRVAARIEELR